MLSRIAAALSALAERMGRLRPRAAIRFGGTRGTGERGEDLAVAALRRAGFRILERNFRTPVGELDVVAEERGTLCFVEVKWRRGTAAGHPGEAITREKQRRIARAAEWYLACRRSPKRPCRFDVVAIIAAPTKDAIIAAPKNDAIIAAPAPRAITAPSDDEASVEIVRDAFRGPFPPRRRR